MMGRTREVVYEITAFQPGSELGMSSIAGPMPTRLHMQLSPAGGSTRVRVHIEASPGGLLKLARPVLEPALRRTFENDFATAKQKIEAGE
jgi:carbon monoxide dehydrogenase subunit G